MIKDPQTREWYESLPKSKLTPPEWVFSPVWSFLYGTMAVSLAVYWWTLEKQKSEARSIQGINYSSAAVEDGKKKGFFVRHDPGVVVFFVALALNLSWSYVFFVMRRPDTSFLIVSALWVMILLTIRLFKKVDKYAAYTLIPYLLWVTLATYLNGYIVWNMPN